MLRRVDDLLSPTRGFMADVRVGGGIPGISSAGFGRVVAQTAAWYPINRHDAARVSCRRGCRPRLVARRDPLGAAVSDRRGHDGAGLEYQSLGVRLGDAVVGGRYYAIASAEAIRWINDTWGIAAFVDAGDASDSLDDFRFALGYGLGARLRTPIGPFRLDVAYGEETRKFRLHFSVGLTF